MAEITDATIRAYPGILAETLRQGRAPAARVWLLIKVVADLPYIEISELKKALCNKRSPLRCFTVRRLEQILAEGDGVFWDVYDNGRLGHFAPARVAINIGAGRAKYPVDFPIKSLLRIKDFKAAVYLSVLAGREGLPTSRKVITEVTGMSKSSQRNYDKATGVEARPNFSVLSPYTEESHQEACWGHGHSVFVYTDHANTVGGGKGEKYTARRLPNSYETSIKQSKRPGRVKKVQREINSVSDRSGALSRIYHSDNKRAMKMATRDQSRPIFGWLGETLLPTAETKPKLKTVGVWVRHVEG